MTRGIVITPGDKGVVQGGNARRMQVRAERKDGFTAEKRQVFLDHLAGCSNVTQAAAAVGFTPTTINYHRRRDPAFARACAEALEVGYVALEAMLIETKRAKFAGSFPALEDELCALTRGGGYAVPGRSPDRADALVWAMSTLILGRAGDGPRIRAL